MIKFRYFASFLSFFAKIIYYNYLTIKRVKNNKKKEEKFLMTKITIKRILSLQLVT